MQCVICKHYLDRIEKLEQSLDQLERDSNANYNLIDSTGGAIETLFERIEKLEKYGVNFKRIDSLVSEINVNNEEFNKRIENLEKQMYWIFCHTLGEKNLSNRVQDIEQNWIDYQQDSAEVLSKISDIEKGHGIKGDIDSLHDLIIKLDRRIEKLESCISLVKDNSYQKWWDSLHKTNSDATSMLPLCGQPCPAQNPTEPPKTFGIGEAVEAMKNGKNVCKKSFEFADSHLLIIDNEVFINRSSIGVSMKWQFSSANLLATDYFVVES